MKPIVYLSICILLFLSCRKISLMEKDRNYPTYTVSGRVRDVFTNIGIANNKINAHFINIKVTLYLALVSL
jgi:hypothetical protein